MKLVRFALNERVPVDEQRRARDLLGCAFASFRFAQESSQIGRFVHFQFVQAQHVIVLLLIEVYHTIGMFVFARDDVDPEFATEMYFVIKFL